jgi:AraC-like DNA-binding protein
MGLKIAENFPRKLLVLPAVLIEVVQNVLVKISHQLAYLLLSTEKNAAEIALAVGYRNIQSLNRYFKKYEGFTPSEYRLASGAAGKKF